jgi:hypothetical protein
LRPDLNGKRVGRESTLNVSKEGGDVPDSSSLTIDQPTGVNPWAVLFDHILYKFTKVSSSKGGRDLVGIEDRFIVIGVGFAVVGTILGVNIVTTSQRIWFDSIDNGVIGDKEIEG